MKQAAKIDKFLQMIDNHRNGILIDNASNEDNIKNLAEGDFMQSGFVCKIVKLNFILDDFEVDFYNGFIYRKKTFDKFILENKIVIIPNDFAENEKMKIREKYKDRKTGDFYSFSSFVEKELARAYRDKFNIFHPIKCRTRESIKFGYNVRWNHNKTEFYCDRELESMI